MKKTYLTLGWLILAGLLFFLCVAFSLLQDRTLFEALLVWLFVLMGTIVFVALLSAIKSFREGVQFQRFISVFQFSRKDYLLLEHWCSGAKVLKRLNRLRTRMPWFVFIGGRFGKTTLLSSASLPILSHHTDAGLVTATRTLKWWFFKQACVLDVGSHYSSSKPTAKRSWARMMQWCKRMHPPKAVLVAISCNELMTKTATELHHYGRDVRVQLEQLMRVYNYRLPIHVMVTGMDQLKGFSSWIDKVTPEQCQHSLGHQWLSVPVVDRDTDFLHPLFNALKKGLVTQCISTMEGTQANAQLAQRLVFGEQLQLLEPPLKKFVVALCEPDAYHATGVLTGIWLTATTRCPQVPNKRVGFFIDNLLTRLLPTSPLYAERRPLNVDNQWRLSLSQVIGVFFAGYLLFSGWQSWRLLHGNNGADTQLQVQRLEQIEEGFRQPLRYLPYLPLMSYLHSRLEAKLLTLLHWHEGNHQLQLEQWRKTFHSADNVQRGDLILNLSASLLLQERMIGNHALTNLAPLADAGAFLPLVFETPASVKEKLIATRAWFRNNPQRVPLTEQRKLLEEWVKSDKQWRWLLRPRNSLPALDAVGVTEGLSLSGIWSEAGERLLKQEIELTARALQDDKHHIFQSFWQQWPQKRQHAWLAFIRDVSTKAASEQIHPLTSADMVALMNGKDAVTNLITLTVQELTSIPETVAQNWLIDMRRILQLHAHSEDGNFSNKASVFEQQLRGWLYHQAGSDRAAGYATRSNIVQWKEWRKSLATTLNIILKQSEILPLTRELFSATQQKNETENILASLRSQFTQLKESLAPTKEGIGNGTVWELLQLQLDAIAGHAVSVAACQLEEQWQLQVLQPLGDPRLRHHPERREEMAWQLFQTFLRSSAAPYLAPSGYGLQASRWQHISMPFSAEFLHMVNNASRAEDLQRLPQRETQQRDALVAINNKMTQLKKSRATMMGQDVDTLITSAPASVPGGAALMPTGSQLILVCDSTRYVLSSANLFEQVRFRWAPGKCNVATLNILFGSNTLTREFRGADAWPKMLRELADSEHVYPLDSFTGHDREFIAQQGVNSVMVRFSINDAHPVQKRWQAWLELDTEIDNMQTQIAELQETTDSSSNYFIGNMMALPATALNCPNRAWKQ